MNSARRLASILLTGGVLAAAAVGLSGPAFADDGGRSIEIHHRVFLRGAHENLLRTAITLPIHQGTSGGQTVWYVVTDSSDRDDAAARGVNFAPKLANARNTTAAQKVTIHNGIIDFPATVTFGLPYQLLPGPTGFPPSAAHPGSIGNPGYSPLIQLPDGTVLDASQIANSTGRLDKITALDTVNQTMTYKETTGFFEGSVVHYVSLDGSKAGPATIEDVTYSMALDAAPAVSDESSASAREDIVAFTNGQTGPTNPQRQGLSSTLLDGLNPLNLVDALPTESPNSAYSPLWDVHLVKWANPANAVLVVSNTDTRALAAAGVITSTTGGGPDATGIPGPANAIANCPLMSIDLVNGG